MRHSQQWANLLGAEVEDAPWEGNPVLLDGPPQPKSVCFGPLAAAAPFIGYALTAVSAGMTVLGAISQSNAQRQAGDAAVANARMRSQQAELQARQQEQEAVLQRANANDAAAVGQRKAIEAQRKGRLMAGRAQAVMAASGAGVDPSMTAGLLAEGNYAGDVANFEGQQNERNYKNAANVNDYNARGLRYSGAAGEWSAQSTKAAYDSAATSTLIGGIGKAGLSIASKYGGDWGGGDEIKNVQPSVPYNIKAKDLPGWGIE